MDILKTVDNMPEDLYLRLKHAAETGRWPEGTKVDENQQASALQLVMAYQARHLNSDEMLTIGPDGKMVEKNKRQIKEDWKDPNSIARMKV